MSQRPVRIAGTGTHLPGEPVKFSDIETVLGEIKNVPPDFQKWYRRTRELMRQILGMENYYYAIDRETGEANDTCAGMAAKASREALELAQLDPQEVDLVIYAGSSVDHFVCPPTSALVQQALGIKHCAELTIHSNCTATYKGLQLASDLISHGRYRTALVCSSNFVSSALKASFFNPAKLERNQAVLRWFLSDGAGAVVLKADPEPGKGLYLRDTYLESVGSDYPPHMYNSMGCATQGPRLDYEAGRHHITQDYREVSQIGPTLFVDGLMRFEAQLEATFGRQALDALVSRLRFFLVNVPTRHLIDLAGEELVKRFSRFQNASVDLYYSTTEKRGYTGPAAIFLTLDRLMRVESLQAGDVVASFVTESSKWMNGGFLLEYLDA